MTEQKEKRKKSRYFFLRQFPVIVIFIISCIGFAAGWIQNDYSGRAESLKNEADEYFQTAELMTSKVQYYIEQDRDLLFDAERTRDEIYTLCLEWLQLIGPESNLTAEDEFTQNVTHLTPIQTALFRMGNQYNRTIAYQMYRFFVLESHMEPFILAEKPIDGFDYFITQDIWESNRTKIYTIIPTLQLLNVSIIDSGFPSDEDCLFRILSDAPSIFFIPYMWELHQIFYEPLFHVKGLAHEVEGQANFYSNLAGKISLGVSITTVAVVLSTSMSSRIEKEFLLSRIREDILKEEELIRKPSDKLSIIILILAVVISGMALVLVWI